MIIIFDSELKGHHLEYVHHLWMGIVKSDPNECYTFAIPQKEWEELKGLRTWPKSEKISLYLISESDRNVNPWLPLFKRSLRECHLIRKVIKECKNVTEVILLNLAIAMPLLPFIISNEIKISGIIYHIDMYAKFNGLLGIKERNVLRQYSKSSIFRNIYILNSPRAVDYYNNTYSTKRFTNLVDPVPEIDFSNLRNLRGEMGIDDDKVVFLHFGAMQKRKGTLLLLHALSKLKQKQEKVFIFAGKIYPEIESEFLNLKRQAQHGGAKIITINKFIDYDYLNDLVYSCDCILAPYLDTCCSSGVIGFGAVLGKPIIGAETGLLGDLIHDNCLGITIPVECDTLATAINNFQPWKITSPYKDINTVEKFNATILGSFSNRYNLE